MLIYDAMKCGKDKTYKWFMKLVAGCKTALVGEKNPAKCFITCYQRILIDGLVSRYKSPGRLLQGTKTTHEEYPTSIWLIRNQLTRSQNLPLWLTLCWVPMKQSMKQICVAELVFACFSYPANCSMNVRYILTLRGGGGSSVCKHPA